MGAYGGQFEYDGMQLSNYYMSGYNGGLGTAFVNSARFGLFETGVYELGHWGAFDYPNGPANHDEVSAVTGLEGFSQALRHTTNKIARQLRYQAPLARLFRLTQMKERTLWKCLDLSMET